MFPKMNSTQTAQNVMYDELRVIILEMYYTIHHTKVNKATANGLQNRTKTQAFSCLLHYCLINVFLFIGLSSVNCHRQQHSFFQKKICLKDFTFLWDN
jgi:hypothetical protein